jgi:hypothetical protein
VHLKRPVNPDGSVRFALHLGSIFVYYQPDRPLAFVILRDFFSRLPSFSHKEDDALSLTSPRCPCFFSRLSLFVFFRRSMKITTCSFLRAHTSVTINSTPKCQLCSSKLVVNVDPQLCQSTLTDRVEKYEICFDTKFARIRLANFSKQNWGVSFDCRVLLPSIREGLRTGLIKKM